VGDRDSEGMVPPEEVPFHADQLRVEALSRQIRNLLLLQPLFHLEANKGRLGGDQHTPFDRIDTLYL